MAQNSILLDKSLHFAARIVKLNKYLIKEKRESVISKQIIRSATSIGANANEAVYGISKAGVINLTRYLATQYGKYGIRCNGVAPGLVLTPAAIDNLTPADRDTFLKYNTLPYAGKPEDIAGTITFLASEDARYISGQTIIADGGMSCHNPTVKEIGK